MPGPMSKERRKEHLALRTTGDADVDKRRVREGHRSGNASFICPGCGRKTHIIFNGPGGQMTIMLSFGRYGGFYVAHGRLCLGWMAITFLPCDIDKLLEKL